ncbi:unnamed protein product [Ilex paraguariensis]|uniref:Uncharacterized protein n=1 Tax=Ilex paraguariensis TaxID=185542 RepID=A0ABC8RMA8_9AQUA
MTLSVKKKNYYTDLGLLANRKLAETLLCAPQDMAEYQMSLFHAIESRLKAKCDKLADVCILDEFDVSSTGNPNTSARLPERVKLIIEDIEREETALQEDLYSVNRKFVEYYNVCVKQVENFFRIIIMWWAVVASIWVAYKNSTMLWWCDLCCFGGDNSGGVDLGYCGRCRFQVGVTMDSGKDEEMRRTIRA